MSRFLLILLVFQTECLIGQNYYDYRSLTYDSIYNRSELLKLDELKASKSMWHFRLWTNEYILDLKEENNGNLLGDVYMLARETNNVKTPNKVFIQTVHLDSYTTIQLKQIVLDFQNKNIPTQDSIIGWGRGFDGLSFGVELFKDNDYSHKTYWQPSLFQHLKEAVVVKSFIDSLETTLVIDKIEGNFYEKIPFRSFTIDGYSMICRPMTKEEIRTSRKAKRKRKKNQSFL